MKKTIMCGICGWIWICSIGIFSASKVLKELSGCLRLSGLDLEDCG